MSNPTNARLFALLERLAGALSAEDIEVVFRRIGEQLDDQEALDLRVSIARALRSFAEARKPHAPEPGELSEDEHAQAARDACDDADDVLAEIGAALVASDLTQAAMHAADLERIAGRLRSHAEQGGRHRWKL